MRKIWYTKEVQTSFSETLENLPSALKKEWFWILTQIDVQSTLKNKIGKDIEEYVILWACNPTLAAEALDAEYEIWLLLPCNIIVYNKNNKTFISAIVPTVAMNMLENERVNSIAETAEEKLIRIIDSLL